MNRWVQGARPRTLVAAVCPVLVGTAAAAAEGPLVAWRAAAALVVALALQVGVNYANDYSDGLRGTDTPARLGPARLTAAGGHSRVVDDEPFGEEEARAKEAIHELHRLLKRQRFVA